MNEALQRNLTTREKLRYNLPVTAAEALTYAEEEVDAMESTGDQDFQDGVNSVLKNPAEYGLIEIDDYPAMLTLLREALA